MRRSNGRVENGCSDPELSSGDRNADRAMRQRTVGFARGPCRRQHQKQRETQQESSLMFALRQRTPAGAPGEDERDQRRGTHNPHRARAMRHTGPTEMTAMRVSMPRHAPERRSGERDGRLRGGAKSVAICTQLAVEFDFPEAVGERRRLTLQGSSR